MRTYLRVSGTLFGSWLWTVRLLPTAATLLAAGPLPDSAYQGSGAVLITSPGTAAREQVIIRLGQGEVYGLLCEFQNADSLPRHSAMGMWAVLRVE